MAREVVGSEYNTSKLAMKLLAKLWLSSLSHNRIYFLVWNSSPLCDLRVTVSSLVVMAILLSWVPAVFITLTTIVTVHCAVLESSYGVMEVWCGSTGMGTVCGAV